MLSVALLVFTLPGLCGGDSENSPLVSMSQRQSLAQVASLRRQLMRDNYDYQHSGDERERPNLNERGVERGGERGVERGVERRRRAGRGDDDAKLYNQTGGADHLLPSSKLPQSNTKLNAEHAPHGHYEQRDQHNQRRQEGHPREQHSNKENHGPTEQPHDHEQPDQHDRQGPHKQQHQFKQLGQNDKYKRRSPREQRGDPQQRGRYEQSGQREQAGNNTRQNQYKRASEPKRGLFDKNGQLQQHEQFEQSGQNVQSHQYEQLFQYDQLGPRKRRDQDEQPNEHKQRESLEKGTQTERRYQHVGRGPHQQRGQYGQSKRFREVGRYPVRGESDQREFDEQQEHSVERINRAARPLADAPSHSPVQHANHPDWPAEYYNKRRETYETPMLPRPFGDLRSNYKEQHPLSQEERADNSTQFHEQELSPEDREAFERQEMSGSEDEGSDFSESQKKPRHHRFRPQARTRADRLQYYTPPPTHRARPRPRGNVPLTYAYAEYGASPEQGPRSHVALDHNISEKNLLYYEDEHQQRRRKIDRSPGEPASDQDESTEDVVSSPQPSADSRHSTDTRPSPASSRAGPSDSTTSRGSVTPSRASPVGSRTSATSSRTSPPSLHIKPAHRPATTAPPDFARTQRAGSYVVTVSANNVTYKIITLKSRDGRRQAARRLLQERGAAGVALVSLDGAPLPALRLPRARRQYMHDHRRRRRRRRPV